MQLNIRPVASPTLSNLKATSGMMSILLSWDLSTDPTYQATQVWGGSVNDVSKATLLATVYGNTYTHKVQDELPHFYWVKALNIYGRADGAFSSSVVQQATPLADLIVTSSPASFHLDSAGNPTVPVITVTATRIALDAGITFSAENCTLSNVTATTCDVAYSSLTGPVATVTAMLTSGGVTYEKSCILSVLKDGVESNIYTVVIESTRGTVFRPGQPTTTLLIAHVFCNDTEVTDSMDASRFRWRRVSMVNPEPPNTDEAWNAAYAQGYKQISLTVDAVNSRATFHCDILDA